jgi:Na+-transporting NADH:ubiquinone oxidoreductase subunit NqrA
VSLNKQVWHLNYQDAIAIGKLFLEGELNCERVIALGGPQVKSPRLVKTTLGASLDDLLAGELEGKTASFPARCSAVPAPTAPTPSLGASICR